MNTLTERQYNQFAKSFLNFYLTNGFGNKTKSDIDAEIYSILCDCEYIDDTKPALLIGKELGATSASINKYKEYRFYMNKIKKEELTKELCKIFEKNATKIVRDKIVCTISNQAVKLHLEYLLQQEKSNYDYSFNTNNISMDLETFVFVYQTINKNAAKLFEKVINSKELKKDKNAETIINIYNQYNNDPKTLAQKWMELIPEGVGLIMSIVKGLIN